MAGKRQKSGHIWGPDQLKYANLYHYDLAMNIDDLREEEYRYQSVLHGPSHARHLTMEIFHKKIRNGVTNKVDVQSIVGDGDSNVVNSMRSRESRNAVSYTRITDDRYNTTVLQPDANMNILYMIKEIAAQCNEEQLKVLAYLIVSEKIDQILFEDSNPHDLGTLGSFIMDIWRLGVKDINSLNHYIGTKYRTEIARRTLCELVRNKFPLLMVGI